MQPSRLEPSKKLQNLGFPPVSATYKNPLPAVRTRRLRLILGPRIYKVILRTLLEKVAWRIDEVCL